MQKLVVGNYSLLTMYVTKATGDKEKYDPNKLCQSMIRSGAPKVVAQNICQIMEKEIRPGMTTEKIWRQTLKHLVREDLLKESARYSFRRGMAGLGPDGFAFEQFVEALLQAEGYDTARNQMVRGESGLDHETDIFARKGNKLCYVESKYKNQYGLRTHVDVVMYNYARFQDIVEHNLTRHKKGQYDYQMWIVTNTEFTSSAMKFAKYRGMHLLGWDHPSHNSLEDLVEKHKLYPVTILPSVTKNDRKAFLSKNLILAQDLIPYSPKKLLKQFGIPEKRAVKIANEVAGLMNE